MEPRRLELCKLLAECAGSTSPELSQPYSVEEFSRQVESLLVKYESQNRPPNTRSQADLHSWVLRYALRMSAATYLRWHEPAPDAPAELRERFRQAVEPYPSTNEDFHQGAVDPESSLRRAMEVHRLLEGKGSVLFLGDDDATSIALALLGDYDIVAADIDSNIISWLQASSAKIGASLQACIADVRQPPASFRKRFTAVVTDPSSDWELAQCFLRAAHYSLQSEGWLFWADHPDLNFGYERLCGLCTELGFETVLVRENWHSYAAAVYNNSTAHWFGLRPELFREMAALIKIWSHLHVTRLVGGGHSR